ncbi:prorelaxin 1-like [Nannospalax galili]|uniref:prorelaxin 1-like n=1 Tax=Nannospalax galili TaxID=1026970 RepID=UPI0004ED07D4|nr:prorelaxin 1-like [Nannospalax galili]
MSRRFLLQLLGFWLLLSRPCRARVSEKWLDEVIKVCGRQYARAVIEICGVSTVRKVAWSQQKPVAEIVPYYHNKDAEPLDTVLGVTPNLPQEQKATEDISPASRRKRNSDKPLREQCCHIGCSRRSIAKFC